jgi:sulfur carrier protein
VNVLLNGRVAELADDATVRDAVVAAGAGADERGIAVALDGTVVPRSAWDTTTLHEDAQLEVLRATAGG